MGRAVLLLIAAEIVGVWILASLFDLEPGHAFGAMVVVLAAAVAGIILVKARSRRD